MLIETAKIQAFERYSTFVQLLAVVELFGSILET